HTRPPFFVASIASVTFRYTPITIIVPERVTRTPGVATSLLLHIFSALIPHSHRPYDQTITVAAGSWTAFLNSSATTCACAKSSAPTLPHGLHAPVGIIQVRALEPSLHQQHRTRIACVTLVL